MRDEKRKNVFFALVETITGENQISWLLRRVFWPLVRVHLQPSMCHPGHGMA